MPPSPLEYLRHILDEAAYLLATREGLTKEQFQGDTTIRRAFCEEHRGYRRSVEESAS